mmetsp:Transcript_13477/g.50179  ORF Transcript_13477/g.50179 Transcript_13477/m.50179 type:complete len:114 (-) Transcript_13477:90-431(-)
MQNDAARCATSRTTTAVIAAVLERGKKLLGPISRRASPLRTTEVPVEFGRGEEERQALRALRRAAGEYPAQRDARVWPRRHAWRCARFVPRIFRRPDEEFPGDSAERSGAPAT